LGDEETIEKNSPTIKNPRMKPETTMTEATPFHHSVQFACHPFQQLLHDLYSSKRNRVCASAISVLRWAI
jgi:hypothetical protein